MMKTDIINSVFPLDKTREQDVIDPSTKHDKSIAIDNPKILRYGWQWLSLAEPRDHTNFKPPHGNLHKSSYCRLGPEKPETGISETTTRLNEIHSKDDYASIFPRRSTLNMFSFSLTENAGWKDTLISSGAKLYPDNYGFTDYRTTSQIEYPLHFPMKPWPSLGKEKPWLLYRRTLSYNDQDLSRRDCSEKFFDEKIDVHNRIAVMKLERYRSYDPINKKFTDPCRLAEYKYKA